MATSFLDKTGLGTLWTKIKSTFALKSEIPDSTSDLTNDSGFITDAGVTSFNGATGAVTYSAQYLVNLTDTYDEDFDTHTYTADKTYQQITAAITEGKIPYVILGDKFYRYYGSNNGEHVFVDAVRYDNMDESIEMSSAMLGSNGTWMIGDFSVPVGQEQSDWAQNDSTALDYVKNRVCYTGNPVMTVITTGTMPANSSYIEYGSESLVKTDAIELLSIDDYPDLGGLEYSVVYGGTTYTGTILSEDQDGWYVNIIGNPNIYNETYTDNGQPFVFNFYAFIVKEDAAPEADTALSISVPVSPVYKLDDKYLNGSLIKRGTGQYSVILNGEKNGLTASGSNSVAEGNHTIASGENSHAEGTNTTASGYASHAEGDSSKATGYVSHAEGVYTTAGENAHAEGSWTTATGFYAHAEGNYTKALGSCDHSEGSYSVASGGGSHSEGYRTTASGQASHSEGGNSDNAVLSTSFGISLTGSANATTYTATTISALQSLIGFYIGGKRVLSETYDGSGYVKTVTLEETLSTTDITSKSFTIGKYGTSASGKNSHSEGFYSSATGYASHAEGFGTYANHRSQHVFGEWNKNDGDKVTPNARGTYVEIVGNGTYNSKSNARTLDWNGNEVLAGKLTVGAAPTANMDVATKQYVDTAVAGSGGGGQTVVETNPTLETEWVDVYSDWAAGYYYDPDNNYAYTQIPSTETTWSESQTYTSTSCTPYSNLIPVVAGEEYQYYNMPIHFDSKNKEVPGVIIFDSNKAEIDAITRSYQDEDPTPITIPTGGAWMAVLYANSQTYVLQKKVAKRLDKDELLDVVKADYRVYTLTPAPTPATLTKTYICLGTDDLRPWETKNLHTLFTTNNIPYYMAAIPENIKACVSGDPYKTNLDYMRLCVAAGGEIICHSNPVITEQNKTDFDTMYTYFAKNKEQLEYYGFKVRGIFKAGGEGAIYDAADPAIDAWAMHHYDFGDYFGGVFPYNFERTLLDDWSDYSYLESAVRSAIQNHTPLIGAFHYYNANAELAMSTILGVLQDYTEGTDYEFVTPSELYDIMMPTTRPSGGGGGSAVTYSLSMSSNVITLTGSNGSTSSVTLPVYTGGVSS